MSKFPTLLKRCMFSFIVLSVALSAGAIAQTAAVNSKANSGDTSASVVIVYDNSKSARSSQGDLRKAALALVKSFGTNDEIALYFAGDGPKLAQDFTGDTSLINKQVDLARGNGKLAFFETLAKAVEHARSDSANERASVVAFVNDLDAANATNSSTLEQSIQQKTGIPVYVVAMRNTSWKGQETAQRLAVLSGGAAFFLGKSSEAPRVAGAIATKLGGSSELAAKGEHESEPTLDNYNVAIVHGIPVENNENTRALPGGDNLLLKRVLVARLAKAKIFTDVRDGGEATADNDSPADAIKPGGGQGNELEVLPMIVSYKGGIRGPGDLLHPFASPKLRVQVVLRDRSTHQPVMSFTEEASGSGGLIHGRGEQVEIQAMSSVSNKIVSRLKEMRKETLNSKKREKKAKGPETAER